MRWAFHAIIALSMGTIIVNKYLFPWASWSIHANEYRRLVVECDQAMHDEIVLRDMSGASGSTDISIKNGNLMKASGDVGLTVCHDYDKLRKRLLIPGVSEERLALLGLEGLENEKIPVSRMVEPHRMPRF